MRKFLIPAALLASTLGVAPAAAQWAPPPPQGYAYGYNNFGQTRRLEARIQRIRHDIRQLDRRNILSNREARRLDGEARNLQFRVREVSRFGINGRERYEIERRVAILEQRVQRAANDRRGYRSSRYLPNGYNQYNPYGYNQNRYVQNDYGRHGDDDDDDDDRYEHERERDHDD